MAKTVVPMQRNTIWPMIFRYSTTLPNYGHLSIAKPMTPTIVDQLKQCCSMKNLEAIYASMMKINANQDCFYINQFVTACSTFSCMDCATFAFTQMESPNVFVFNSLIKGFVSCGLPIHALECYVELLRAHVLPSSYTFSSLIKGCGLVCDLRFGEGVHCHIWKHGFHSHVFVQTALIDFYSKVGGIDGARRVFDEMPERDAFARTTMLSAFVCAGDLGGARRLFEEMPERNIASWNTMLDGYTKSGNVESAELLFNQMSGKDIISWTTMITCYSQNRRFREALAVFNEMKINEISPDEVTMATIISACAHLGALDIGKDIHLYVMQNEFDLDVYLTSALIDMYAKCGSLEMSLLVFVKSRKKNLFCWNSVIEGLAVHGYAEEALAMFSRMERQMIKPNGVTFISVLSACTHRGLVDEGRKRFLSMKCDYLIPPAIEHYGCMVDLLSKAGLLEEALELVRTMKFVPNSVIWGALLAGCKLHRNLEIARVAVNELMVLEPTNSGYYTLLVNMHAEVNGWSEVSRIRTIMKGLGVEKTCPGSSWIEMQREVHQFAAYDTSSHPASGEIYSLLAELDGQLKLSSHTPEHETDYIFTNKCLYSNSWSHSF